MKNKKIKCDIYTRVSTTMQVDGYSLDAQKEKLKRYAEFQNMEIVNEYSDEGKMCIRDRSISDFECYILYAVFENVFRIGLSSNTNWFLREFSDLYYSESFDDMLCLYNYSSNI